MRKKKKGGRRIDRLISRNSQKKWEKEKKRGKNWDRDMCDSERKGGGVLELHILLFAASRVRVVSNLAAAWGEKKRKERGGGLPWRPMHKQLALPVLKPNQGKKGGRQKKG